MAQVIFLTWCVLCALLFAAHFVHLQADFPNHSRWREWAKFTDEGWYGNAAIHQQIRKLDSGGAFAAPAGSPSPVRSPSWFVAGDFNPGVALPIWPLLLSLVFHFTGLSVTAARALSVTMLGVNCLLLYALTRRVTRSRWAGLAAVTVVLTSMYWFAFDRLAILEPMATAFLLGAFLVAERLGARAIYGRGDGYAGDAGQRMRWLLLLGVLCCALLLTKTTGVFLLPGLLLLLRPQGRLRLVARGWLRDAAFVAGTLGVCYGGYFLLVWRAGYAADFRYLFTSNLYPRPTTLAGWSVDLWETIRGSLCMGVILPWTALAATVLRAALRRELPRVDAAIWTGTFVYLLFIFLHNNPQPRYYLPISMLMVVIAVSAATDLLTCGTRPGRWAGRALLFLLAVASLSGGTEMVRYLRRPHYTLVNAAHALTAYIDQHPNGHRILLSISGDEISLMTGLPALCDDFGTWDLADRIDHYEPGWFATWNDIDYGTLQDIHTYGWLERAQTFPAMDDPDRNVLILYKLHPLPGKDVGVPEADEEP